ncbi:Uncharacterised protein [Mycolicibacterium vanbaalenii]|uniref:Uncharacterized protein n=1 Tax=Mycolicibacterium vanbaalenii TaxID=110539 RepID=A0A5S9RAP9_MYCVN|nr:Uncharacterised protein [Mycolicibacterium vanbaalenii]
MLTASEMTSATTPTTKIEVNALPTSRNGLRSSSTGRACVCAYSSTSPTMSAAGAAPTGANWVSAPASPAYTEPAVGPSGSWEYARPTVDASNAGAAAEASAAPRASAMSASSGAFTGSATRCSRWTLTELTSTPEPTTNMPCGGAS